jgi:transcription elongation factor B subunit 1
MNEEKYGGCEGPDAMYVKLISSDGHEFIVKREHALTSGTIKGELFVPLDVYWIFINYFILAMLSGPGQFAENEANEVNFREIP